jgi:hypothetical protein
MNIEHCDFLSWFSRKRESHKQDGETLTAQQASCNAASASGDPAMAFEPSSDRNGQSPIRQAAAWLPGNSGRLMRSADKRAGRSRTQIS